MSLILSGTDGLSDVDGTAATPAIRGTDANTGIFFGTDIIGFAEGGAECARFDSSGNFGLGVTPNAWSLIKGLQVTGGGFFGSYLNNSYMGANWYFDGASKYIASDFATEYEQNDGKHIWYTAPSGTAGNAITFTQAMTLDADGDLGIGQTSPAFKLDVQVAVGGAIAVRPSTSTGNAKQSALRLYGSDSVTASRYAEVACFNDTAGSDTNALQFSTGFGATIFERARISSDGNLLVGGTTQLGKLTVETTTAGTYTGYNRNTNATPGAAVVDLAIFSAASPNNTTAGFYFASDNIGAKAIIYSNGGLHNYSANNVNLSDRREKTNFAPATSYLDKICAIPVQTFNYIDQNMEDDGGLTLGVVAQDVQEVAPELVMESNWAGKDEEPKMRLSIYQTDLQYALMKCIQEQQALITTLTARITALESA